MLIIKSIKFKHSRSLKPNKFKQVRVSYGASVGVTKKRPIENEGKSMQWVENITMPIFFNKEMNFEVFTSHTFGYHPEELDSILTSSMTIVNFKESFHEENVFNTNCDIIGKLVVKFHVVNQKMPEILSQIDGIGQIVVTSLLVHFNKSHGLSANFQLKTGRFTVTSSEMEIIGNEVTTLQSLRLKSLGESMDEELSMKVFVDGQPLYQASISLDGIQESPIRYRSADLLNDQSRKVGHVFFNVHFKSFKNDKKPRGSSNPRLPVLNGDSRHRHSTLMTERNQFPMGRTRSTNKFQTKINSKNIYDVKLFNIGEQVRTRASEKEAHIDIEAGSIKQLKTQNNAIN